MRVLLVILLLSAALGATAAEEPAYSLVRLYLDSPAAAAFLAAHPELDVAVVKRGIAAEIVADPDDLRTLRESGLRHDVVHEDLVAFYASRITRKDGGNFGLWRTYGENTAFVDSLRLRFPEVVSAKWSLGQTLQGRDLWCFRVSDNPDVDESEPEVLIDGMHHAREIMASEFPILFAEHLAARYGTDPVVTWLLDNRELYVVPIVNPDGVVYNEQTDPQGGGMWRKNRRPNAGGSYGVDLNRNYPYHWGEEGASGDPWEETYRGPSAGSEPEVQALMALIDAHQFVTHQSVHTFGNYTLHPWGYTSVPCPDDALFTAMGQIMTQANGYEYGSPPELLYLTSGSTTDWAYGAPGHPEILSMSNEIGGDGFWPAESRREALFQENVWPNLFLLMAAGEFVDVTGVLAADGAGGLLEPGEDGRLDVALASRAARSAIAGATLRIACDDPYVQLGAVEFAVGALAPLGQTTVADVPLAVRPECPAGHVVPLTLTLDWGGGPVAFARAFTVGPETTLLADSFASGLGNWTLDGAWGLTTTAHSPPYALTDSPAGDYADDTLATATLNGTWHASRLTFWHRYAIENGWDYGRVQVAPEGGAWTTVASFTGTQNTWQQVDVDLTDWTGTPLRVRFLLESDYWIAEDGWYIDDVVLLGAGGADLPPPPPMSLAPADGAGVGPSPTLTVANSADPEGAEPVTYGFRIWGDADLTQLVAAADGVAEGPGQTSWAPADLAGGTYWWRAYAADPGQWGLLGETRGFTVTTTEVDGVALGGPRLTVLGGGGGSARLQLTLARSGAVRVAIYNARGQQVRELYAGHLDAGSRELTWDGRDGRARPVGSGVYFVRAIAGDAALTGRVVIVR